MTAPVPVVWPLGCTELFFLCLYYFDLEISTKYRTAASKFGPKNQDSAKLILDSIQVLLYTCAILRIAWSLKASMGNALPVRLSKRRRASTSYQYLGLVG